MIGAYAGCVHHRHMVLPKMACLRPFQPVPGCGRGLHQGPSKRGAAGLEPASASGSAIELHPCRTAINPSANARPQAPASYGRSTGRKTIHGSAAAGTSPATPPRQRVRGTVPTSVNGSQAGQDSNLQHTVPKTVVLPFAPPAYMPVCASTHSLDAIRRPGCDGHRPPLRPPANACCATTGWMPWGPVSWVRCPSCPSRPTGGVPFCAFGGIRTRGLPLRRRTPYPLGHEGNRPPTPA